MQVYIKVLLTNLAIFVFRWCAPSERLIDLTFGHIQRRREYHWAIVDLLGKGGHIRTVPMPDCVKHTIDDWLVIRQLAHLARVVSRVKGHLEPSGANVR